MTITATIRKKTMTPPIRTIFADMSPSSGRVAAPAANPARGPGQF